MTAPVIDVTEHRRLVTWVIARRGFMRRAKGSVSKDDLVQQGMIGLMRAAQTFDPNIASFSTYAIQWIRQSVSRFLQDHGPCVVRVPVHLQASRIKRGEPTHPVVRRIDAPLRRDDDLTLADVLAGDAPSPEDGAIECERKAELSSLIRKAGLTPRERRVLMLRSHETSLQDIGAEIDLTRERVRQIEIEAISKLRRAAGVPDSAPHVPIARAESTPRGGKRRRKPNHRLETKATCHVKTNQPESL